MSDTHIQPPQVPRRLGRRRRRRRRSAPAARCSPPLGAGADVAFKPEKGATLRVLRWSRFVQGDIDAYMANVKKFTEKTGIRCGSTTKAGKTSGPKAAVAANTGAGPDIILSTNDDANLYPDKLLDVTDLAEYLGKKYGGWYPAGEAVQSPRRQEVDRAPARRGRLDDGLPREHGEGGRLRQLPEGHRRLPEDVQGGQGKGHAGRHGARQRDRRRPLVQLARSGRSAASSSTRTTRS